MKSCAFFGHRDIYEKGLFERVTKIVIELIENEGFTQFYSGGRGKRIINVCDFKH